MSEMNNIVKLAVDVYSGSVEKYSNAEANETLRKALIKANNDSSVIDYRAIRDGRCNGMFAIVEEIIKNTIPDALMKNEGLQRLAEFRNIALGDKNLFVVEDSELFFVADTAEGTQGVRRQRLGGTQDVSIPVTLKTVRIYEELNRVLSGRVDFNYFIDKVAESFVKRLWDDINSVWQSVTTDQLGGATYDVSGTYDEEDVLELIEHVEAAAGGKPAVILATKAAARKLKASVQSNDANNDLYHMGLYGYFYGTPIIPIPQRHKSGSTEFVVSDDVITVISGDQKPIKVVYEGNPIVNMGDPLANADLTVEYFCGDRYGVGVVLGTNSGVGRYTFQ